MKSSKKTSPQRAFLSFVIKPKLDKMNAILRKHNLKPIRHKVLIEASQAALEESEQKQSQKTAQISFTIAKGRFVDQKTGEWAKVAISEKSLEQVIDWLQTCQDFLLKPDLSKPGLFKKPLLPADAKWAQSTALLKMLLSRMRSLNRISSRELNKITGRSHKRLPSPKKELPVGYTERTLKGLTATSLGIALAKEFIAANQPAPLEKKHTFISRVCKAVSEILKVVNCPISPKALQKAISSSR